MARQGFNKNQPRDSRGRWSGGGGSGGGGGGRGGKPVGTFMQRQKAKLEQSKRDKTFKGKTTLGRDAKEQYKARKRIAKYDAARKPSADQQARNKRFSSKAERTDLGSDARYLYKLQSGAARKAKKEGRLADAKIAQAGVDRTVSRFSAGRTAATKSKRVPKATQERRVRLRQLQGEQRLRNFKASAEGQRFEQAKKRANSPVGRASRAIGMQAASARSAVRGLARRVKRALR